MNLQPNQQANPIGPPTPAPIAPNLGLNYPFPPHLTYQYPPVNETIIRNISSALIAVPAFYTQVLHLMNKMNLPPPFSDSQPRLRIINGEIKQIKRLSEMAESESEHDDDDEEDEELAEEKPEPPKTSASASTVYQPKRIQTETSSSTVPAVPSTPEATLKPTEESTPIVEKPPKSIKIQLHTNISKSNIFTKNTDLSQPTKPKSKTLDIFESKEAKRTCATLKEIENGILIQSELLRIPKFQNYNPGEPSTKLFIRNLAKTVTQDDFYYLFGHLFKTDEETKESLQIQLFKEGNLKNSAFVTFPTEYKAGLALEHLHGFKFKGKPLLIVYSNQKQADNKPKEEEVKEVTVDDVIATL